MWLAGDKIFGTGAWFQPENEFYNSYASGGGSQGWARVFRALGKGITWLDG